MKVFTSTAIFALATGIFASSASAADLDRTAGDPTSASYEAPVDKDWSGVWVGAVGGYQFGNSELNYGAECFDEGVLTESSHATIDGLGSDGLFGELQIGFDKQISRYVVGVFGGLNKTDAEHDISVGELDLGSASVLSFHQEWGGVLGARAGILKSPDTMFYLAGGWAFGEMGKIKTVGIEVFPDQETDLSGWFAEIGMETRVYDNVYLSVSGRYTDYGSLTLFKDGGEDCCGDFSEKLELDHDTLAVMAGLKVKLNGGLGF